MGAGRGRNYFDWNWPSKTDQKIIAETLPDGCGPKVAICGHTHAARQIRLKDERMFINTGTWTDLIDFSGLSDDTDEATREFIDQVEQHAVPMANRLTYAEVTEAGGSLKVWAE